MFKKFGIKKLILAITSVLLLLVAILAAFVYYKGKAVEAAVINHINQFNAKQKDYSAKMVEATSFFSSKDYTIHVLANIPSTLNPNKDNKSIVATVSFVINHGVGEVLSGRDAHIEVLSTVNNYTAIIERLPRLNQLLPMLNQIQLKEAIKLQGFFDWNSNESLSGEFQTLNLRQVAKPILKTDEFSGSLDWNLSQKEAKLTLNQPQLTLSSQMTNTVDAHQNDNSVPIVLMPKSDLLKIDDVSLTFSLSENLLPNNILLQAKRLSTAQWTLDGVTLEFKPVLKNNLLVDIEAQLIGNELTYDKNDYGSVKSHVLIGNLSYQLLEALVTKAQARYALDTENNNRIYPLLVYYFAQWLNIEKEFLNHRPFVQIKELHIENKQNHMVLALDWSFTNDLNILSTNQPVINAVFNRTNRIDINLNISQPMFKKILTNILAKQSIETDSSVVNKYLFAFNEMNQTLPFMLVNQSVSPDQKREVSGLSLLDETAMLKFKLKYDTADENVFWLDKEVKQFDFIAFINKILD